MNVLFFTYAYPPLKYPRSVQISRLVKNSEHQITVVCCDDFGAAKDPTIPGIFSERPHEVIRYPRKKQSRSLLRRAINALSVPDPYRAWALLAADTLIHSGELLAADVIVTFGQPMSDHLAGLEIKKNTGKPWVAHFSDPWADNPFHGRNLVRHWLDRIYERRVVEAADMLIFTSHQTMALVMAKYPASWHAKARVLPHCFDPDLYSDMSSNDSELVVRHLGNFYPPRSPDKLLEAMRLINERSPEVLRGVKVELVGNMSDRIHLGSILSKLPEGLVRLVPSVEYVESLKLMAASDLLLVIDAPFEISVFLPSKLIDYIGAGRPIFAVTPLGTSAEIVLQYGCVVADPSDAGDIAEKLADVINQLKTNRMASMVNSGLQNDYSAVRVAAEFDKMLSSAARSE